MYNSQDVAERIKELAQKHNVTIKQLLSDVGLGFNTMSNMRTSMPKSDNLAKIADYFDCSVDYLLGRVDTPNGIYFINNNNTTINGTQANVINNTPAEKPDDLTEQFFNKFAELSFEEKIDTMQYVNKTYRVKKTKIYEE